jgi:hypothetical protein
MLEGRLQYDNPSLSNFGPKSFPEAAFSLVSVAGQQSLVFSQIQQKTVASDAVGRDFVAVNY